MKVEKKMERYRLKVMACRLLFIGVLLCGLSQTASASAAPQHNGGVPTLNANAQTKRQNAERTEYDTRRINRAAAAAYSQQHQSASSSFTLPMLPQSSFKTSTIAPVAPAGVSGKAQPAPSVNGHVLSYLSSDKARKGASNSGMSGGASASGLMSTGSRYSSAATNEGGATVCSPSTPPTRPRRVDVGDNPDIPFPDPIGDAMWPLALCAFAYVLAMYLRKRKRA